MQVTEQDVDISWKLANNVGDGIVELIYENDIKKLVMGAAADSHYTEGMVDITSTKAEYVSCHASHCCKIWLVYNGNLIQTREGRFDLVSNSSSDSLSSLHASESALIPYEGESQRDEHDTESIEDFQSARGLETMMYYEEQRRILEIEELKREKLNRQSEEALSSSFGITQMLYHEDVRRRREAEEELNRAKSEIEKSKKIQKERDEAVKTTQELLRRLKLERGESSSSSSSSLSHSSQLSPFQWFVANEPPPYFICPISQDIMRNPHVAADGYTYEANEFKNWLRHGGVKSPMTNRKLDHHNLTPNIVLRTANQDWLQQHPYFLDLSDDI